MTDPPRRIRLVTEWSTDDPQLAETLKLIASEPEWSVVRHEMEAGLHMMQARFAWRRADQLREQQREHARRQGRAAGAGDGRKEYRRGECPACHAQVRLRLDGTVRVHDVGHDWAQSRALGPVDRCVGAGLPPSTALPSTDG